MRQITIVGASAGVGLLTVKQALQKGLTVVALARTTIPLADQPNLVKLAGSATSVSDVKKAIMGSDAIIITVGQGNSLKATTLFTDVATTLLQALNELKVQPPLVVLTGFGAGDSASYVGFPRNLVFRFLLNDIYANKTAMETQISTNYPKWVVVRPGRLTDKPPTGNYRILDQLTKGMDIGAISRADVAHYLVEQAQHPSMLGHYMSLGK